jgi:hypothetical protein
MGESGLIEVLAQRSDTVVVALLWYLTIRTFTGLLTRMAAAVEDLARAVGPRKERP